MMIISQNKNKKAFTMLELIFVIVIMAIIGKFGVEFLAQAYQSFISSSVNNRLQASSATAVEFIASRLQYRIKASTIARETNGSYSLLPTYTNATAPVLEWIGADIEGFRGDSLPLWSGIVDLNTTVTTTTLVHSPATDTSKANILIGKLSNGAANINGSAIYFINPNALNTADSWGWDGPTTAFNTQNDVEIHPIRRDVNITNFIPVEGNNIGTDNNLSGVTASEFYQLAWTAYAVGITDWNATGNNTGTLRMWYNYQPWQDEEYNVTGTQVDIMDNVSSFRFISSGTIVKIQVCVKSDLLANEEYSICKEKTIY